MTMPTVLDTVRTALSTWRNDPSSLLQILIEIQQHFSYIPEQAVSALARELNLSQAIIRGVVDFYSFLHLTPRGRYDILFSDNIVDQMLGSRALAQDLAAQLQMQPGTTRSDGLVSLDFTSCTGMGDQGPAALVNGLTLTNLDQSRIQAMAALIEAQKPVPQWPVEWFDVAPNIQQAGWLLKTALKPDAACQMARTEGADAVLAVLEKSGLRGRGGAGFQTAMKWRFCRDAKGEKKTVVCNADEGEPGTFKDRVLLQNYFELLIEGMRLCATVIGAQQGLIYLRGEYRYLLPKLNTDLRQARDVGLLDDCFDIQIHLGAGAYICGEESALIESLEGKRGIPRVRPPFPVSSGYLQTPTVVNNVETFIAAALVIQQGADEFLQHGSEQSSGTKLLSVSGDCARPGIYEVDFGVTIAEVLNACGAVDTQAVQVAGPAGQLLPPAQFNRQIAFNDVATGGSFMVFDNRRDVFDVVDNFNRFFVHESCGFCTPCRVGNSLLQKRFTKLKTSHATQMDLDTMKKIGQLMRETSHCGLGMTAANPLLQLMEHFPQQVKSHLSEKDFEPAFDLQAALEEARRVTQSQHTAEQEKLS